MSTNLLGTDYLVYVDSVTALTAARGTALNYKLLACITSNGFEISNAGVETSNKCDEGYATSLAGLGSWTMSGDGQAVSLETAEATTKINYQKLLELALNKQTFFLLWADVARGVVREGKVRISTYGETAGNAEPYTFTVSFVGIGKPFIIPAV